MFAWIPGTCHYISRAVCAVEDSLFLPEPEFPGIALAPGVWLRNPLVHLFHPPPSHQLLPALLGFGVLGRSDALFNPHHLFCLETKKEGKKLMFG